MNNTNDRTVVSPNIVLSTSTVLPFLYDQYKKILFLYNKTNVKLRVMDLASVLGLLARIGSTHSIFPTL